jgi:hypothetical protein
MGICVYLFPQFWYFLVFSGITGITGIVRSTAQYHLIPQLCIWYQVLSLVLMVSLVL